MQILSMNYTLFYSSLTNRTESLTEVLQVLANFIKVDFP